MIIMSAVDTVRVFVGQSYPVSEDTDGESLNVDAPQARQFLSVFLFLKRHHCLHDTNTHDPGLPRPSGLSSEKEVLPNELVAIMKLSAYVTIYGHDVDSFFD